MPVYQVTPEQLLGSDLLNGETRALLNASSAAMTRVESARAELAEREYTLTRAQAAVAEAEAEVEAAEEANGEAGAAAANAFLTAMNIQEPE